MNLIVILGFNLALKPILPLMKTAQTLALRLMLILRSHVTRDLQVLSIDAMQLS